MSSAKSWGIKSLHDVKGASVVGFDTKKIETYRGILMDITKKGSLVLSMYQGSKGYTTIENADEYIWCLDTDLDCIRRTKRRSLEQIALPIFEKTQ